MAKLKGKSRDEVTRSRSWSLRSLCMWRYGAALRPIKIVLESVNRGQLISKKETSPSPTTTNKQTKSYFSIFSTTDRKLK